LTEGSDIFNWFHNYPALPTSLSMEAFRNEIKLLMRTIRQLDLMQISLAGTKADPTAIVSFSQLCSAVDHRLLSIHISECGNISPLTLECLICEVSRIATLAASFYYHLPRLNRPPLTLQKQQKKNISDLEALGNEFAMNCDATKMLLWACWLAALPVSEEQEWFIERIHFYMTRLRLTAWNEMEGCFELFVWTNAMRNRRCYQLWERVQTAAVLSVVEDMTDIWPIDM
jgi:hypothetical protein